RERRVPGQRLAAERQQRLLAVRRLGDRGEHAGRRQGRAGAGSVVDHGDLEAALRGPPGHDEADQPAAGDGNRHAAPAPGCGRHESASSNDRVAAAGSGASDTAPTTATPYAPSASRAGTRSAVTPPIAITGTGTARATAPMPAGPIGSGSPDFVVVANAGPTPR